MRRPEVRLRSRASNLSPQLRICSVTIHGKPLRQELLHVIFLICNKSVEPFFMLSFFYQYELLVIRVSLSFHFGNFSESKSKLSIISCLFRLPQSFACKPYPHPPPAVTPSTSKQKILPVISPL